MDERLVRNTFEGEYSSVTSNYAGKGVSDTRRKLLHCRFQKLVSRQHESSF